MNNRLLMAVFGPIAIDARVQRAAEALGKPFEVTVLSIGPKSHYHHEKFKSVNLTFPQGTRFELSYLYYLLRLTLKTFRIRPTVLYAHDRFLGMPVWLLARLIRAKFIYDAHELIVPKGLTNCFYEYLFYLMEKTIIHRADLVISTNLERAKLMQDHYRLRRVPLVIQNIVPYRNQVHSDVAIKSRFPAITSYQSDSVLVVYQGYIDCARELDRLISALKECPGNVGLLIIGDGPDLPGLKEHTQREGLSNKVTFLGTVPNEDLHGLLTLCHIGVVSYPSDGLNNLYCSPNKLHDYLQAGLPVLATCQMTLKAILSEYKVGVLVGCAETPDDPRCFDLTTTGIANAITHLMNNLEEFKTDIPRFLQYHNWENEKKRLTKEVMNVSHPITRQRNSHAPV